MYLVWKWIGSKVGKPFSYEKRLAIEVIEHYDKTVDQLGKALTDKLRRKFNEQKN
tara:strand:+ start:458 stop:622 length:165 start_codon:yes stop_codon:yes gene_type:complete